MRRSVEDDSDNNGLPHSFSFGCLVWIGTQDLFETSAIAPNSNDIISNLITNA